MKKIWFDEAWEDYEYWQAENNKAYQYATQGH
jgi:Txe/YoeB family toxin of Txe-Axe toxin-antitoxin module